MKLVYASLMTISLSTILMMGFLSEAFAGEFDLYRAQLQSRSYNEGLIATKKFAVIAENLENTTLGRMQCSYGPCIPRDISLTPDVLRDLSEGHLEYYVSIDSFSVDDLARVTTEASTLLESLNQESEREGKIITEMSGFKIFTDGDEENSGFDLMSDLDRINEVIFSEDIIYPNTKNTITLEFDEINKIAQTKILFAQQTSQQKKQNLQKASSVNTMSDQSALSSPGDAPSLANLLEQSPDLLCLPSDRVDIRPSSQVSTPIATLGRNIGNSSANGAFGISINPSNRTSSASNPCGPNTFFCVTSEAIKYSYPLFGGKKNISIDSIISRHANVGQEYQHADLTPGKPTGQFFESNRTKLNLGANFTMQIVVGELPMPSANMDKRAKKDPKDAQSTPESIKNLYREAVAESFRAYGLTYGSYEKNAENTANITDITLNCDPKNTSSTCFDRLTQGFVDTTIPTGPTLLPTSITNQAWKEDIRSLALFSKSFAQSIELISKEMQTLNNKPRQPQK